MDRSDFASTGLDDRLRPLTAEGARKMRKNARGLAVALGSAEPERLFSSPWARAKSTAEILAAHAWPGLPIEERPELEGDRNLEEALALARDLAADGTRTACFVGHEPCLSRLIGRLLAKRSLGIVEMKKGGACSLRIDAEAEPPLASLEWLATPRLLRAMAP